MPSNRNRRPRVLVVNAFADGRDMYVEYLRYRGYPVREATTPTAALPLVRRFRPEVIVTDFVFPDSADGVAFISSVRGMQRLPQPFVVVVSGHVLASERQRARDARATHS